jgi:hypothetical protein
MSEQISAAERYPKQEARIRGKSMAYVEVGAGAPIVFLQPPPTCGAT